MVWEYLSLTVEKYGGWRPRYLEGEEIEGWKKLNIYDYLTKLGAKGWELVAVWGFTYNAVRYTFKRIPPKG